MKSDNLKEVEISKTVEGKATPILQAIVILAEAFYRSYYRRGASKVRSSLILLLVLLGGGGASLGGLFGNGTSHSYQFSQITRTNKTHVDDADAEFVSKVLGTTEDHWHKVFQAEGRTHHESPN